MGGALGPGKRGPREGGAGWAEAEGGRRGAGGGRRGRPEQAVPKGAGGGARPAPGELLNPGARKRSRRGWEGSVPLGAGRGGLGDPRATWALPELEVAGGSRFLSSRGSGGVCAMGDPERPEAARPELDEVKVAAVPCPAP